MKNKFQTFQNMYNRNYRRRKTKIEDQKKNRKDINWKKDYDLKVKWSIYWSGIKNSQNQTNSGEMYEFQG